MIETQKQHKSYNRGASNGRWKGGRFIDAHGYMRICISPEDEFFRPMAIKQNHSSTYILEHRLVMAKHLGRCLLPWEVVHHKNSIKDDNRIENLQLLPTKRYHIIDTVTKSLIARLKKKAQEQQGEITLLKAENTRLRQVINGS